MSVQITRQALERMVLLARELARRIPWSPLPDSPQQLAYESQADVIGFGGAAGGGKTDLAIGKAITHHRKVMIMRRVGTELTGIEDRIEEIVADGRKGYNSQKKIWKYRRPDGVKVQIELGSIPNTDDEKGYQGRPHDLLVFDEAANFLEHQVRFLMGWVRSTVPGQKCQTLMTFNPPTTAEGRWIVAFFAPWLDPKHPNPAQAGELRWFGTVNGKDVEVRGPERFVVDKDSGQPVYEFDPKDHRAEDVIEPKSRTFIPSKVVDNPFLMRGNYMSQLQALPEPLRSQMLYGDFMAGMTDDPWQVIPTAWVEAAMNRWIEPEKYAALHQGVMPPMDSLGVDVARGGGDKTIISRRHGVWYDKLLKYPGKETPDGNSVAALTLLARRNFAPIHLDVIGVGASPYDQLRSQRQQVLGINVAEKSNGTDKSGRLGFINQRSELWWRLREALDPDNATGIMLPPDTELKADLCAPIWKLSGAKIQVEGREDIIERIGRSPDAASAVILAQIETPNLSLLPKAGPAAQAREYDPYEATR